MHVGAAQWQYFEDEKKCIALKSFDYSYILNIAKEKSKAHQSWKWLLYDV